MPREIALLCERLAGSAIHDIAPHGCDEDDRIDAMQTGIAAAVKGWPKFDPALGVQPQTFLYPKIKNAMIDFFRRRSSLERRVDAYRNEQMARGGLSEPGAVLDEHQKQAEWLEGILLQAKRKYLKLKSLNRGRTYPMPQTVALGYLMHEYGLGIRECARFLSDRDDLCAVLKLKSVPHYSTLSRAMALFRTLGDLNPATDTPPE